MKKQTAIALGLVLMASAAIVGSNASKTNYAQILQKKIAEDPSLRRFTTSIRSGNGRNYLKKQATKQTPTRYGLIRPRTVKTVDQNESKFQKRTVSKRISSFSTPKNKSSFSALTKYQAKDLSFGAQAYRTVNTEQFVVQIPGTLSAINQTETGLTATNNNGVSLEIKQFPALSEAVGFETAARNLAANELRKDLDLNNNKQARNIESHLGKNHIRQNQTPPTYFFEKINDVLSFNNNLVVTQRVQQNPDGGFIYMAVTAPKSQADNSIEMAHQVFSTFNLK